MRANFYTTKTFVAHISCQIEVILITFVFAIVFTVLTIYAYKAAIGPLFVMSIFAGIGCWLLFIVEMYFFFTQHRATIEKGNQE